MIWCVFVNLLGFNVYVYKGYLSVVDICFVSKVNIKIWYFRGMVSK